MKTVCYGRDDLATTLQNPFPPGSVVATILQNFENNVLWSRMMSRLGEAMSRLEEATSQCGLLLTDFSCSSCPDFFHLVPKDNLSLGAMM